MNARPKIGLPFAGLSCQWDNMRMRKTLFTLFYPLAVAMMLVGIASSQTKPATPAKKPTTPAKSQPAAAAKAPAKTTAKSGAAGSLTTRKDRFSYALGMNFGRGLGERLKEQTVEFDPSLVAQGLKDALSGAKLRLTDDEARAVLAEVQTELQKEAQAKQKQEADKNKAEGDAFLAANKAKEGVVTLPDGLQYKVLTAGTGPKPTATDTVVCHYKGTFVDGKEFDSSYKRGEPLTIPVSGVIKGWTEALQLMPVGSKWQLVIPSDLAYGPGGRPGMPPNETLVFEVELISIQEKKPEAKTPDAGTPDAPSTTGSTPSAPSSAEPKK
jgi:FKBP-type peptidyl-prolyl cis-trans isomerase